MKKIFEIESKDGQKVQVEVTREEFVKEAIEKGASDCFFIECFYAAKKALGDDYMNQMKGVYLKAEVA